MAGASSPLRRGKRGAGREWGLRALAETVGRLTAPLIGSRRLLAADLALAWEEIAGDRLAVASHPDRLVFPPKRSNDGTLHLRVATGAAALEVQHEAHRLIDRINAHLGYGAVARLKVVQAPLPPPRAVRARPAPPPANATDDNQIEAIDPQTLAGIEDERLRLALARLGRRILADARGGGSGTRAGEACPNNDKPL